MRLYVKVRFETTFKSILDAKVGSQVGVLFLLSGSAGSSCSSDRCRNAGIQFCSNIGVFATSTYHGAKTWAADVALFERVEAAFGKVI